MPKKIEDLPPKWDDIEEEWEHVPLKCQWTITCEDGTLAIIITSLE